MIAEEKKEYFLNLVKAKHQDLLEKGSSYKLFMQKAFDHFQEVGLPDKKNESFQYFPLKELYSIEEKTESLSEIFEHHTHFKDHILPECQQSYIWVHNGSLDQAHSVTSDIPASVVFESLSESKSQYMPFVHLKMQNAQKKEKDPFVLLTQSMMQGLVLIIPPKLKIEKPLQIIFSQDELTSFSNIYIHVGKDAEVDLIFTRSSQSKGAQFVCVDLEIESSAKVNIQRVSTHDFTIKLDFVKAILKKNAKFEMVDVSVPSILERLKLHVIHQDEGANSHFNALGLIEEKKQAHYVTLFEHTSPNTTSYQHVKTALFSKAKASFEGQIFVQPNALLTQSYQKHETLLLGDHAIINSLPNLQILADDVKASHGATIAALDANMLHYLKTRGIAEKVAKVMLLEGFCLQIIEKLNLDSLNEIAASLVQDLKAEDIHAL
jgi:Fe-S cluster assembly protein SufD